MKKSLFLLVLSISICSFLSAQSSASSFSVYSANHIDNFNSWDEFVISTDKMAIEWERINYNNAQQIAGRLNIRFIAHTWWVKELTRVEEAIIDRAIQQIPASPRIGSAWLVDLRGIPSIGRNIFYNVFLFADPDGLIYYRMLISSNHYY